MQAPAAPTNSTANTAPTTTAPRSDELLGLLIGTNLVGSTGVCPVRARRPVGCVMGLLLFFITQ
ncbi:hypothetical protein [Pseudarthrobacter sp. NamE5]|uniref:hypothetical protein n=1 Tax=Pseudarthrobacter sp. NamE5 TaxID=2576839 RepID=UPI00110BA4A3|nr:hypothetical protein [Pseudarthrobacter sp. NamE5]TLM80892.1 hypothetical protein FDW84_18815 [Pseudarthrobacter sp. NamE5]